VQEKKIRGHDVRIVGKKQGQIKYYVILKKFGCRKGLIEKKNIARQELKKSTV
jgi:hypothetical protein